MCQGGCIYRVAFCHDFEVAIHFSGTIGSYAIHRRKDVLSHPNWVYELKYDGFRALAFIESGTTRLVSRNGFTCKRFDGLCEELRKTFGKRELILDEEIACLDADADRTLIS